MQIDMHYYGVFALARLAGMDFKTAQMVAHCSQYVDDALSDRAVPISGQRAVLPTMTSHKPLDYQNTLPGDQWKVWVPFHFLPGNDPQAEDFEQRMVCRKNSELAQGILKHALQHKNEAYAPHLIGITAHVFADTFAHYGFIGLSSHWNRLEENEIDLKNVNQGESAYEYVSRMFRKVKNKIAGGFAELVPVGHGAAATYPDEPYLKWEFKYEEKHRAPDEYCKRNNPATFYEACQELHKFFKDFVDGSPHYGDVTKAIEPAVWGSKVKEILQEKGDKDDRSRLWKTAINDGVLFPPTDDDRTVKYDEDDWSNDSIQRHFDKRPTDADESCQACQFMKAAWIHRHFVLRELLPQHKLIMEYPAPVVDPTG